MRLIPNLLAVLCLLFLPVPGTAEEATPAAERWRFNSRLQTERGLEALQGGKVDDAVAAFDSARRLESGSPLTSFNAATARLVAGRPDAVTELLEAAAIAPPELAAAANYNLGNAQLVAGDPAAAIESFKNVLRIDPSLEDAKFNLELAQRLLEEQRKRQQQQQEQKEQQQQGGDQSQQPDPQKSPQGDEDRQEGSEEEGEGEQQESDSNTQPQPEPQGQSEEQESESTLHDFEEQEDMTAEQAAAILEAIENLERDQRRKQAEERARRRAREGKDW